MLRGQQHTALPISRRILNKDENRLEAAERKWKEEDGEKYDDESSQRVLVE